MINPPIPEKKKTGSCMEVRLNSPSGKFKRTNMADDQVDIPGASFIEEEIEKFILTQLKLWLKCLCINQNAYKKN